MPNTLVSRRYALALTGAAAAWGVATVIAKQALTEIPPHPSFPSNSGSASRSSQLCLWSSAKASHFPQSYDVSGSWVFSTREFPTPSASSD